MDINLITTLFSIIVLIISAAIHEFSHGYAAYILGDPTAQNEGRLTLNPIPHLDLIGSILLPGLLALTGSPFVLGWAKPVPYNPYNLKNRRWGELIVAAAGPLSNLIIAITAGIFIRLDLFNGDVNSILFIIVLINIVLMIFNLFPVPPLDGSKILFGLFPKLRKLRQILEQYKLIFFFVFILFIWQYISPVIFIIASLISGQGL